MDEIKVSVIIPVYNVENYLEECLSSLAKQTLTEIEFICIDDGSIDNSANILEGFEKDDRFRIIHKKNEGYGKTMNLGLQLARGEYIGIVESDDYVLPEMFERLYMSVLKDDCDFVKSDYIAFSKVWSEKRHVYASCTYNKMFDNDDNLSRFQYSNMCIWTGIYKKEFLKNNNISFLETPGASFQDIGFMFKVFVSMKRGLFIEDAFLFYRTDNADSSVKDSKKVYCVCEEIEECFRYLENEGKEQFYPYLVKMAFLIYKWNVKRISINCVEAFVRKIAKEYQNWVSKGYYNPELFSVDERNEFETIVETEATSHDKIWRERLTLQPSQVNFYHSVMLDTIKKYKEIYIYGKGKISAQFVHFLRNNGYDGNFSFIVTKKNENETGVYEVSETELDKNRMVFIAVKDNYSRIEIMENLFSLGFKNVIVLDDNLIEAIRIK